MIRSRAGCKNLPMPGRGASDEFLGVFTRVACGHGRVRFGLVRAGGATSRHAGRARPGAGDFKPSAEPFGLTASPLDGGGLYEKWLGVQRRLDDELVQIALCDGDRDGCVSPAALKFLAIIDTAKLRDGRARLGEVNRAINLAIRPISDLVQYGQADVWTFAAGDAGQRRRRLRRLRDREIRCLAAGRHRARRPAYRHHA